MESLKSTAYQASQCLSISFALLFPVLSVLVEPSASMFLALMVLASPLGFLTSEKRLLLPPAHRWIVLVFYLNIIFALAVFFIKGYNYQGWRELGRIGRLLLLWPVLSFFLYARPPLKFFWFGVCIASAGAGCMAIYELAWLGVGRANATMNAILFGDISLVYSALSGIAVAYFYRTNRTVLAALAVVASVLGMLAVVASGTRGAWLAAPVISAVLLYSAWGTLSLTLRLAAIFSPVLLVVVVLCVPQFGIQSRLSTVDKELGKFQSGLVQGSLGVRLEMWRASTGAWLDSPMLGQGQGRYSDYVEEGVSEGFYSKNIARYNHSHSDYFFTLASRGAIGLVLLIAMYALLIRYAYSKRRASAAGRVNLGALALVVLVVGYVLFGLTEAMFIRSQAISVFVLLVGFLLAAVEYEFSGDLSGLVDK